MFPRALRTRIVVSIAGFMAASLAMGFLWVHHGLRVVLQNENDSLLERTASEIAGLSSDTSEQGWTELTEELDREVEAHEGKALTAVIRRGEETLVVPSRPAARDLAKVLAARPPVTTPTTTPATVKLPSGAQFRVLDLPEFSGVSGPVRISLAMSLRASDGTLRDFDRQVATGVVVFLVISIVGGWLLAHQAVRPIALSIRTARRLDPADLTERLPRTGVGDELDQLADTINGLLGRLETYHRQIVRFTADASHELRGPLAAMRAGIEVSLHQARSAEEYRDVLGSLAEQCDRLTELTNSLLLLARADAGEMQVQHQPVEICPLVANLVELFHPLAEERYVELQMLRREQATINGDAALLQRLVSNLLDNAIKFADRNTAVTIDLSIEAQRLALRIHNRGPAIDPKLLPHVFERFFQVDSARSSGGSGLGLSICKWIVDAHAGEITMQSDAEGTRVTVLLPVEARGSGNQNR